MKLQICTKVSIEKIAALKEARYGNKWEKSVVEKYRNTLELEGHRYA